MNLHQKIKPHHHVSIWAASVLAVILSASMYTNATITKADNSSFQPDQKTRSFFGDGESGDQAKQFSEPAACSQQQQATNDAQRQQLFQQEGDLNQKISDLQNQLHNAAQDGLTQDQQDQISSQISTDQTQLDSVKKQIDTLGGQDGSQGASEDCKVALLAQMKVHSDVFTSKIKTVLLPRLDQISVILTKISSDIDQLKAEGADPATVTALQADVTKAEKDLATIKSFFNSMYTVMSGFQAHENSADDAFNYMKSNQPSKTLQASAASAATDLVKTFTSLQDSIKKLTGGS